MDSNEEQAFNSDSEKESNVNELSPSMRSNRYKRSGRNEEMGKKYAPYKLLTTNDVIRTMNDIITEVNAVVQLSPTITRILLNHLKWDRDKLYERYYGGDTKELFKEARVIDPTLSPQMKRLKHSETETCVICFDDYVTAKLIGLGCGHNYCNDCWVNYLTVKIVDDGMGNEIMCPSPECDIVVDDKTVMSLITDPKVKHKYEYFIASSFVESSKFFRWCPNSCNYAAKVESNYNCQPIKCICGTSFCFQCGHNWHEPLKCDLLKKWVAKCNDSNLTAKWIVVNTKDCPNCGVPIEKNGGCNHMQCTNRNCKTSFCWMCLKPMKDHCTCNSFNKAVEDVDPTSNKAICRATLERYLFYYNRYMNHMHSFNLENKLYESVAEKMKEMQEEHRIAWIEVQFLNQAVDVLCQCRQTLMYTYGFAYFLSKTNQSLIFEGNQRDLEQATEVLSQYLERDISEDYNIHEMQQNVQNKYRYCETRRKVLIQHVQEGYERNTWDFNESLDI